MPEKTFIDKLAYIEIKDRKLLVTLSQGKDTWYIPGGKRNGNETDLEALAREVKEELSVNLKPNTDRYPLN
jgi:8-oxo-dGTP pyrophosphatase MutT (NUDIX family)